MPISSVNSFQYKLAFANKLKNVFDQIVGRLTVIEMLFNLYNEFIYVFFSFKLVSSHTINFVAATMIEERLRFIIKQFLVTVSCS